MEKKTFDDEELRKRLTAEQYEVTQNAATERAFTGKYDQENRVGTYACIVCEEPLFASEAKFDSGCGWPSFSKPLEPEAVDTESDRSFGMVRTEVLCSGCGAHLGHVFPDGPLPTGDRYCMNSASLNLELASAKSEEA